MTDATMHQVMRTPATGDRRQPHWLALLLVLLFVTLAMLLAGQGLSAIERALRAQLGDTLTTVNQSAAQTLRLWIEAREREVAHIARDLALWRLVSELEAQITDTPPTAAPALAALRQRLSAQRDLVGSDDFLLLRPDGLVLAASTDPPIGRIHGLPKCQPLAFTRALAGVPVFIPPHYLDGVDLGAACEPETLFLLAPVSDPRGNLRALLALRLNPATALGHLTRIGHIGASGETYAFDRRGRLLTPSRFAPDTVGTEAPRIVESARAGEDGMDTDGYRDYRGVPVIGVWSWSRELGLGLATEMDLAEALEPYRALRGPLLGALFGVIVLALGLTGALLSFGRRARIRLDQLIEARTRELRKYVQAVEQNPLCILVTDATGAIEYVNPAFTQITGYDVAEAAGENPRLLKSEQTPLETYQALWATILAGVTWHGELCNRKKTGEHYWASLSIAPVKDHSGAITHFVGIAQDLTATKQAELALREAEAARNLALDAAEVGLWSGDLLTDTWHWDARVARLLGLPEDEPAAVQRWIAVLHPEDRARVVSAFEAAIGALQILEIEYRVCWPDGSERVLAARGKTVGDDQGRPVRIDGVVYDRTELRRAEAEIAAAREHNQQVLLEARDAAEQATRAKSDFLANMSHEIRTPMNVILGMAHLALQTELNERQRNYIDKVHRSAELLLGIINDILDFSKIEAGKLDMEHADFRLEDVLDHLANLVGLKAEERGLALRFELPAELPTALIGDALRLGQVLINLGNNAVKFTEPGGEVLVRVAVEEEHAEQVKLHFSVHDTGIGLSPQQQQRLFQSFTQADSSTTRKYGGSGLGLAICKRLTALMSGEIWVDSALGAGSTFHFTARFGKQRGRRSSRRLAVDDHPRAALSDSGDANREAATAAALAQLRGAHILLVEDNAINQELALELLITNGMTAAVANNGQEALERLRAASFDGVLMDCQMPVMDGYQATHAIRQHPDWRTLPVLAMTANVIAGDRERALAAGMNDHIGKPVRVSEMLATMAKWIQGHGRAADASVAPEARTTRTARAALPAPPVLAPLPGINTTVGLEIAQGNQALYRRLLQRFRTSQAGFAQEFTAALTSADPQAATRCAHTLKGVAANIGATAVHAAAEALEAACHTGQSPDTLTAQLQTTLDALEPVLAGLAQLDAAPAPADAPEPVPTMELSALQSELERLRALLEDDDTEALAVIASLPQQLGAHPLAADLHPVAQALEAYDFDAALAALAALECRYLSAPMARAKC
jgi:polar amino acid transport system substrate-binding protein